MEMRGSGLKTMEQEGAGVKENAHCAVVQFFSLNRVILLTFTPDH